jgi:hypothetical protein
MQTRITVNGVEYRSVDEMPPDVRRQYDKMMAMLADRDGNGVPDLLQGKGSTQSIRSTRGVSSMSHEGIVEHIEINGKTYNRLEDVPRELREMIEETRRSGNPHTTVVETRRSMPLISGTAHTDPAGGFTIRITWPTVFAVLTIVGIILLGWWLKN